MNLFGRIYRFYRDGFASMTIGRSLWLLIIIKVAILFLVLKLFFFPNVVKNESEKRGIPAAEIVKTTVMDRTTQD